MKLPNIIQEADIFSLEEGVPINPTTELNSMGGLFDGDIAYEGLDNTIEVGGGGAEAYVFYSSRGRALEDMADSIARIIVGLDEDEVIFVSYPRERVDIENEVELLLNRVGDKHYVRYGDRVPLDTTVLIDTMKTWRLLRTSFGGTSIDITYRTPSEADVRRPRLREIYRMCTRTTFEGLKKSYPVVDREMYKLGPKLREVGEVGGILILLERWEELVESTTSRKTKNPLLELMGYDTIDSCNNILREASRESDNLREWCKKYKLKYSIIREAVEEASPDVDDLASLRRALARTFPIAYMDTDGNYDGMIIGDEVIPSAIQAVGPSSIVVIVEKNSLIKMAMLLDTNILVKTQMKTINYVPGLISEGDDRDYE